MSTPGDWAKFGDPLAAVGLEGLQRALYYADYTIIIIRTPQNSGTLYQTVQTKATLSSGIAAVATTPESSLGSPRRVPREPNTPEIRNIA